MRETRAIMMIGKAPKLGTHTQPRKSTSGAGQHDVERSMRDSLNCSFVEGGSGGGGRCVRAGVYTCCKCSV